MISYILNRWTWKQRKKNISNLLFFCWSKKPNISSEINGKKLSRKRSKFWFKKRVLKIQNYYRILSSIMRIQVQCAPEFHNDFWQFFKYFKNNFTRINHCKFIHHKRHLKPFLSYLLCRVCREYFSIIFNVKKVFTILHKIWYII